jgi:hypothetical protein
MTIAREIDGLAFKIEKHSYLQAVTDLQSIGFAQLIADRFKTLRSALIGSLRLYREFNILIVDFWTLQGALDCSAHKKPERTLLLLSQTIQHRTASSWPPASYNHGIATAVA